MSNPTVAAGTPSEAGAQRRAPLTARRLMALAAVSPALVFLSWYCLPAFPAPRAGASASEAYILAWAALALAALSVVLSVVATRAKSHRTARIVIGVLALYCAYKTVAWAGAFGNSAGSFYVSVARPQGPIEARAGQAVDFEAVATGHGKDVSDRTSFVWDFGDGQKGTGRETTHVYRKGGSYNVSVYGTFSDSTGSYTSSATNS